MGRVERVIGLVLVLVFAAGAVLLVTGFVGRPASSGSVDAGEVSASTVVAAGEGSERVVEIPDSSPAVADESPAGGDVDAAEAAAVAVVESMGDVAAEGRLGRRRVVAEFTTDEFFPVFIEQTNASLAELDAAAALGVEVSEWALRSSVGDGDDGRVEVLVWSMSVIEVDDEVRAMWRTVAVTMRLVERRWLVDGWESFAGPSPGPGSGASFATGLEMRSVAQWDRAA